MSQTTPHDDDMPAEIDFAGAKRGQFHQAGAQLHLPVYLEREVQDRRVEIAKARRAQRPVALQRVLVIRVEIVLPHDPQGLDQPPAVGDRDMIEREGFRRRYADRAGIVLNGALAHL